MTPMSCRTLTFAAALLTCAAAVALAQPSVVRGTAASGRDWPSYGGDPGGARYSSLAQISRDNVAKLEVAWKFSTGEAGPDYTTGRRTSFEATPLVIDGTLYLSTALGRVFALDAETGAERWRFSAGVPHVAKFGDFANRGVSYWSDPRAARGARCGKRILLTTVDARLIALDARDGGTCAGFGEGGTVDLRRRLRNAPSEFEEYEVTSPPAIVGGVIVVGSAVADNNRTDAASGEVRGYDVRTGALRWTFDPVPQSADDPAFASWKGTNAHRTGAANAWSVIAADTARGMVFVPTSSPSPDYYGGERLGDNRYANSVVALRAATGAVVWSFQTVHHDLWDYDNASPPALVMVRRGGRMIPAVAQATKTGMLYLLHRDTGVPIVPVEERAVPASTVAGEIASPTQPFSTLPSLVPRTLDRAQIFGADSADRAACRAMIAGLDFDGIFTPPSVRGTLVIPSNIGGAHWGGVAFDPHRQLVIVPVNEVAAVVQLIPREKFDGHGEAGWEYASMRGTPYMMRRRILLSPAGVPCTPPPFGALVAMNVETGSIAWRVPLGSPRPVGEASAPRRGGAAPAPVATPLASAARGAARAESAATRLLGSPNLGGPIVTAGGVVFIGATLDRQFHAYDVETGAELWHATLPAGGKATPMTYAVKGRQFVAIAAGGDGDVFGKGDELVVYALPRKR